MESLIQEADKHGDTIQLIPSGEFGSDLKKLKTWYKRFGFISRKNFMIRKPKK